MSISGYYYCFRYNGYLLVEILKSEEEQPESQDSKPLIVKMKAAAVPSFDSFGNIRLCLEFK